MAVLLWAEHPISAWSFPAPLPSGQEPRQQANAVVFLDDAVKATKLAAIDVGIIDRPNELPVTVTVMDDTHNWRVIFQHTTTDKNASVWVLGEGPLGLRKLLVVNIVHHSGRE